MDKLSVVIPTMWKYGPFISFLKQLNDADIVDEIILVDNNPDASIEPTFEKIRYFKPKRNIFVNAALNVGVAMARNNKIVLINDDVIFDTKILYRALDFIGPGMIAAVSSKPHNSDETVVGEAKVYELIDGMETFHCGAVMFVYKPSWVDIPAGMDLYYGDNWIWDTHRIRGEKLYVIKDVFFHSPTSVTSSLFYTPEILWREGTIFEQCIAAFKERVERADY